MRDGVKLSAHIRRPDAEGRFPAIMNYTPYRKGPLVEGTRDPMVERGYASVVFDIRGTGDSEGWNDSIYSGTERQDGYDMVEWIAEQPWCDGNVGMWGISFGAVVSLQMAGAAPPHLKAIIARSGTDDPYTEWTNPGGCLRLYMYQCYAAIMAARNFAPPDPREWGERWEEVWQERLNKNIPWGMSWIRNLEDGPFWRERSLRGKYDKVKCAVFVVGGWADWYYTPLLRIFQNLSVPKRALIGPWCHQWPDQGIPGPRIDWQREAFKWWDYWLKGIDTGVMDGPPLTIFIREYSKPATILAEDKGEFRCENEWPIARTQYTPLYLRDNGQLRRQPPSEKEEGSGKDELQFDPRVGTCSGMQGGGPFNINWVMPLDQRPDEVHSLSYTSEVLTDEMEVIGLPRVVLHFSSTAEVTLLAVKLCDVAPDGTSALVTKGYLNVTHRESHDNPSFIEPGKVYEIEVELLACAYRLKRGHRIRLNIANADFLNVWPTPKLCTNTIYRGPDRASRIILPIVGAGTEPVPGPDLHLSPDVPRIEELTRPSFCVGRDIINDLATSEYENPEIKNKARFTVSAKNPANASLHSEGSFSCNYDGKEIETHATCLTESDAANFHHSVDLTVTIDGKEYFRKSWKESVPRGFC
jgi:putative CocE/NonD family hydrolase